MARLRLDILRPRKRRTPPPEFPLRSEQLDRRLLLAGDPSLSLTLSPLSVGENAGPGAVNGSITRNNMDTSQSLTVNLLSSDAAHANVASSVTIPAGQATANFNVNPVD